LFIVVNIILLVGLIWLIFQTYELSTRNALLRGQLSELDSKKNKLSNSQLEFNRSASSLEILNGYFVAPDQKVALMDNLEKLAKKAGIVYTLNSVLDQSQFSLDISISGSFKNIYYFTRLVETSGYWVSFKKMSLSQGTKDSDGDWSGSLVISIPINSSPI